MWIDNAKLDTEPILLRKILSSASEKDDKYFTKCAMGNNHIT